jgi:hypothetical protein
MLETRIMTTVASYVPQFLVLVPVGGLETAWSCSSPYPAIGVVSNMTLLEQGAILFGNDGQVYGLAWKRIPWEQGTTITIPMNAYV